MRHILIDMLDFRDVGPPFLLYLRELFEAFFGVAISLAFLFDFCELFSKGGPCWGPFSQILQILYRQKCAEVEA